MADDRRVQWQREQRRLDRIFVTMAIVVVVAAVLIYGFIAYVGLHFVRKWW